MRQLTVRARTLEVPVQVVLGEPGEVAEVAFIVVVVVTARVEIWVHPPRLVVAETKSGEVRQVDTAVGVEIVAHYDDIADLCFNAAGIFHDDYSLRAKVQAMNRASASDYRA